MKKRFERLHYSLTIVMLVIIACICFGFIARFIIPFFGFILYLLMLPAIFFPFFFIYSLSYQYFRYSLKLEMKAMKQSETIWKVTAIGAEEHRRNIFNILFIVFVIFFGVLYLILTDYQFVNLLGITCIFGYLLFRSWHEHLKKNILICLLGFALALILSILINAGFWYLLGYLGCLPALIILRIRKKDH